MSRLIPINEKTGVNSYAIVDNEDYEKISQHRWYFNSRGYVVTDLWQKDTKKNKRILLHRMILELTDSKIFIDHINHDVLDNRRENLRPCSHKENNRNCVGQRGRKGQYKGAYQTKYRSWTAIIVVDGKNIGLGTYYEEIEAALAYDKAARKYFGEFAHLNFPDITDYSRLDQPKRNPNMTSKYRGINYDKKSKKWIANKTVDYKKYYLGTFDTEEKALEKLNQFCQERGL